MSDQFRATIKQRFAWEDVGGADLPMGLFKEFDEKFKAWEIRRGLRDENAPKQPLKGNALRCKLSSESKKRMLAAEAAKQAKKNAKKKLTAKDKPTRFAPDIVGKQFSSDANAKRKIKSYIEKNYLIIPADYEFGVNKIDWGKYEITGSRKQTKK
jgi:hypothetical protein